MSRLSIRVLKLVGSFVLAFACFLFLFSSPAKADDFLTADAFIDMNGSPVGTQASVSIMTAGTKGSGITWQVNDSVAAMKVGPQRITLPAPVKVGNTIYPVDYAHQSLQYDTSYNFNTFRGFFNDDYRALTAAGHFTPGIPDEGDSGSLSDLVRVHLTQGAGAVMQLYNGNGPGYVLNIEKYGGNTTHSSKIIVSPGTTYWYSFKVDYVVGMAYLNVYDATTFELIGSTSISTPTGAIDYIQYGNGEDAASSGRGVNFNYFENSIIDYTNAVFPLGPTITPTPPPVPDTEAPTTPVNLQATTVTSNSVGLSWDASSDNISVVGYKIFRDDVLVGVSPAPTYTDTGLASLTNYNYTVSSYDTAGNNSATSSPPLLVQTTFDSPPSVSITSPTNGAILGAGNKTITATATDDNGVAGVQFLVDGVNLGTEDLSSPYSRSWSTSGVADGLHTLSAIARDTTGNTTQTDIIITLDTVAPTGSVVINSGATVTNTRNVTLNLDALDAIGPVMQMRFSNSTTGFSAAENYNLTKTWTLSSGSGTKTVRVQFKDAAGNWSQSFSDTIVLDTTAPTISNVIVANRTNNSATITWTTNEPATSQIQYGPTTSYGFISPLDENLVTTHSVTITGLSSNKRYYYRVISTDVAGNQRFGSRNNFTTRP